MKEKERLWLLEEEGKRKVNNCFVGGGIAELRKKQGMSKGSQRDAIYYHFRRQKHL